MCLLHSNFRKIEGKCERVRTHGASPERLKPNNPMSYIYWFMPLISPVSNDIIIQLNICASVSVCVRPNSFKSFHPSYVYLEQMSLKLEAHPDAMELRGWASGYVGGRTNERTVVHSVDSRFPQTHTFYVVSHVSYVYRWCFGTGSRKNLRLTLLPCLPHCLFIILCNAIRLTPFSI